MSLTSDLRAGLTGIFETVLLAAPVDFTPEVTPRAASEDPLGYDLSCVDDIDPLAREVSEEEMLCEALARRLSTPRGSLGDDDPDYGRDVTSYLSRRMSEAEIAAIPGELRGELMKDERISDVTIRVVRFDQEARFECELDGVATFGPFRFTFAATPAAVSLLVRGEA